MNSVELYSQSIGCNEYLSKFIISALKQKLLANDLQIEQFYKNFILNGPSAYVKGVSYPLGAKVWANGYDITGNTFGIYVSIIDKNVTDPSTEDGYHSWKRFEIESMNDFTLQMLHNIIEKFNNHISEYHLQGESNDNYLKCNLDNIAYTYGISSLVLSALTVTNYDDKNNILHYNQRFYNLNESTTVLSSNVEIVQNTNITADYTTTKVPYYRSTFQSETQNIWKNFDITFILNFALSDYSLNVSLIANDLCSTLHDVNSLQHSIAYTYNESISGFSIMTNTTAQNFDILVECIGKCNKQ